MSRWSKNGVLSRVFAALQTEGIIQINAEVVCLDSTSVKVHLDGTGLKKKKAGDWKTVRGTHHEDSYGYRI